MREDSLGGAGRTGGFGRRGGTLDTGAKALPESHHRIVAEEGGRPFPAPDPRHLLGDRLVAERRSGEHPGRAERFSRACLKSGLVGGEGG